MTRPEVEKERNQLNSYLMEERKREEMLMAEQNRLVAEQKRITSELNTCRSKQNRYSNRLHMISVEV